MKPLLLEFQAFGPYRNKETVDFEKLAKSGIFLIKGPTGSGKTTIFDAMTYALYGGSSGDEQKNKAGRNDFESWCCNQADKDTETYVMFEFEAQGKRYRFTRSLIPKRVRLEEQLDASELDDDGNWRPLFENPKKDSLNKKAEELIGLSKEQFRQVVLLPQGQFEKFLTADSSQKEEILSKIFGTDAWAAYAARFYDAAKTCKDQLDETKKRIDIVIAEEGQGFTCLDDLEGYIESLGANLAEVEKAHAEFDAAGKQQKLSEDIALGEKFKHLRKLENDRIALNDQKATIDEAIRLLANAERAEAVRPALETYENASKASGDRRAELKAAEDRVPDKKQAVDDAETAKKVHEEASPVEGYQKKIAEYEAKKSAYSSMQDAADELKTAKQAVATASKQAELAKTALERATADAAAILERSKQLETSAISLRTRYYSGIYGELAAELKENEKCPVCGSTSHPEPAEKSPDSVSKAEMEAAESAAAKARKAFETQESARKTADTAYSEAAKKLTDAEAELKVAQSNFDMLKTQLIEGIADTVALEKEIRKFSNKISEYNNTAKTLAEALDNAKTTYQKQKSAVEHAKQELSNAVARESAAKTAMEELLAASGYESIEQVKSMLMDADARKAESERITEYRTKCDSNEQALNQMSSELSGCVEPDADSFDSRQMEIRTESENYQSAKTSLDNSISRLDAKVRELKPLEKMYNENITQAESDYAFARKLRGDSGIGLQRYVLGIMFNQVVAEANEMLKNIHGGRYQLIRTDDKGKGNKKGLELIAHDNRSPEQEGRKVGTLSGGEKFLVSLALSIGMSSVAQRSGIRIEALFIDEGFGTLDDESINDAMDVLEYVKRGSSLVGIISHVQLLEANIGTHINVVKTDEGSRIE